jgi:NTP pyrophosphatase (non-canonical NTP hydrolase)
MSNFEGFDSPEHFDELIECFDDEMTLDEYQDQATQFAFYKGSVIYPTLGLAGEAGEVAEKIKKLMRDDNLDFTNEDLEEYLTDEQVHDIALELSDVLWYLANLANDIGYSLEDIADINLHKLHSRKVRGKLKGSGDNR